MVCQAGFEPWLTTVMPHRSQLSQPHATVLALWSVGMVRARSCALDGGQSLAGLGEPAQSAHRPTTAACVVRGGPAQTGLPAPGAACRARLCAPARRGGERVAPGMGRGGGDAAAPPPLASGPLHAGTVACRPRIARRGMGPWTGPACCGLRSRGVTAEAAEEKWAAVSIGDQNRPLKGPGGGARVVRQPLRPLVNRGLQPLDGRLHGADASFQGPEVALDRSRGLLPPR